MKKMNHKIHKNHVVPHLMRDPLSDSSGGYTASFHRTRPNPHRANSESGRSMVEMLGTLAIMGVLAIGGVAGYRWAMDKYRANDTIKELSQRALVYGQQVNQRTELSSAEFNPQNTTSLGYALTPSLVNGHPEYFQIALSGVPKAVCQNIVNEDWMLPVALSVNGVDDVGEGVTCTEEENNAMILTFHKDLSLEAFNENATDNDGNVPESTDNGDEMTCSASDSDSESTDATDSTTETESESTETDSGSNSPEESVSGSSGSQCGYDMFYASLWGECYSCNDTNPNLVDMQECHSCEGEHKRFMATDGICMSCNTRYASDTEDSECDRCSQRVMFGNVCVLKDQVPESCDPDQFRTTDGCQMCSETGSYSTSKDECLTACTGDNKRIYSNFQAKCYPCSTSHSLSNIDPEECKTACAGTKYEREMRNGYCALKNCNGFRSSDGDCYPCSESSSIYVGDTEAGKTECARCKDSGSPRYMDRSYCDKCPTSLTSTSLNTPEKCESCNGTWNSSTNKCS